LRGGSQPLTDLSEQPPVKDSKQSLVTVTFSPTEDDLDLSLSNRDPKLGNWRIKKNNEFFLSFFH